MRNGYLLIDAQDLRTDLAPYDKKGPQAAECFDVHAVAALPFKLVRTLLPDPPPAEFQALLERRRRLGQDRRDEVWEGVLHMGPAPWHRHARIAQQLAELLGPLARAAGLEPTMHEFNVGEPDDYRIPDGGLHRDPGDVLYHPTVALVVEVVSPGDETWEKLPFYASHHVDELLVVDPQKRSVDWLALESSEYQPIDRSRLIDLGPAELAERIDWPPVEQSADAGS